jgi:hypothetical protein
VERTYLVCDEEDVADHTNTESAYTVKTSVLCLVAEVCADNIGKETTYVDGDSQRLNYLTAPSTSETVNDSRQEDGETVEHTQPNELSNGVGVDLPVFHSLHDILALEFLSRCCLTDFLHAEQNKVSAVFFGQKAGRLGTVG